MSWACWRLQCRMPGGAPSVFAPVWSRIWGTWHGAEPLFPAEDSSQMQLSKLLRSSGLLRTSVATAEALGGHILAFALPLSLLGVPLCHMPSRETNTPPHRPLSQALLCGTTRRAQHYLVCIFLWEEIFHFLFKAKTDAVLIKNH